MDGKADQNQDEKLDDAVDAIIDNGDEILQALHILKAYKEAGIERQLGAVQKALGLSRGTIMEILITKGSTWGFPDSYDDELFKHQADPYDLVNWLKGLRSVNDLINGVEAILRRYDGDEERLEDD